MNKRFLNKTVIVTGSGSGIGETTAMKFAEEGANVVIAELNDISGTEVSKQINKKGGNSIFIIL